MVPYTYHDLLKPLAGTREAAKIALLSAQVKVEQWLLGEIVFNGSRQYPTLDFDLEEKRRDLTVRQRLSDGRAGALLDWVITGKPMHFLSVGDRSRPLHSLGAQAHNDPVPFCPRFEIVPGELPCARSCLPVYRLSRCLLLWRVRTG
jgi:hypothetical protein